MNFKDNIITSAVSKSIYHQICSIKGAFYVIKGCFIFADFCCAGTGVLKGTFFTYQNLCFHHARNPCTKTVVWFLLKLLNIHNVVSYLSLGWNNYRNTTLMQLCPRQTLVHYGKYSIQCFWRLSCIEGNPTLLQTTNC